MHHLKYFLCLNTLSPEHCFTESSDLLWCVNLSSLLIHWELSIKHKGEGHLSVTSAYWYTSICPCVTSWSGADAGHSRDHAHCSPPPPQWQHSLFSLISVVCEAPIWLLLSFTIYTCYILEQFAACLWPRGLRLEIQRCKLSFKCAVTLKINDRGSLRKVKNKQNTGCQPSKKVLHADEITQCCWSSSVSAGSLTS